jgi:site-specific recombinase XerD
MNKSESTIHIYYEAIKYFYSLHGLSNIVPRIGIKRIPQKLPVVLSQEEVLKILKTCESLRFKTIFTLIYSAGLMVSEATNLKLTDIDYDRKQILIRNSKNHKDRYSILANNTIELLKLYINVYKPIDYLFYNQRDISRKVSTSYIQKYFKILLRKTNTNPTAHVHTLRHCFATHLVENGTNLFFVMRLLGHSNIQTTMVYLHLQSFKSLNIQSPLDKMNFMNDNNLDNILCLQSIA